MLRNIKVPTGNILIVEGEKGNLECLSIGDYGRERNVKADFLGLGKKIDGVDNGETMPLSEKWVITISTQYGCSMGCKFCDVPKVGSGKNASFNDLEKQIRLSLSLHPEVRETKRLNVHYARMGEPTFNDKVILNAIDLPEISAPHVGNSLIHPVVSTMLPRRNKFLKSFLHAWCEVKNYNYRGNAGLQFSINSTDDEQRNFLFNGNSLSLDQISEIGKELPSPTGRKYALNIALTDKSIICPEKMAMLFRPDKFMVKITPIHLTRSSEDNGIKTTDGYSRYTPYEECENGLKKAGFDVLVFIPSEDEDKGLITCGNAILSGNTPGCEWSELSVKN